MRAAPDLPVGTPAVDRPRRRLLAVAMAQAGLDLAGTMGMVVALQPTAARGAAGAAPLVVENVTRLYPVAVARIVVPRSVDDVVRALREWPGQVAVGGGRYSMGGQIGVKDGLHLDLRQLGGLVWLRPDAKAVRVQAGMRWRDLQDHLDPLDLAVRTMQSYANFSVGGSVSVNAHGRYIGHGPVGHSVRALQLVLADGSVVECSRQQQPALFRAAIGGYGAMGVITEVELDVATNRRIERRVAPVPLEDYPRWFQAEVLQDPRAVLHNADLLPPRFDAPVAVTWREAAPDTPLTEPARLVPRGQAYALERQVIWAVSELPGGALVRRDVLHPLLHRGPAVRWLNHEASLDVAELEPRSRRRTTFVLQEYFVPPRHFVAFARGMAQVLRSHGVEALNVSIRHTVADRDAMLPWAREDVFSFVLYHRQGTVPAALERVQRWTRELIDLALRYDGRYYLPYQLHATRAQFEAAYPEATALRRLKREVDPAGRFSNELWRRYLVGA